MIQFDKDDMTILETLNETEAKIFVAFLCSELRRHERDIVFIRERVGLIADKFGWDEGRSI